MPESNYCSTDDKQDLTEQNETFCSAILFYLLISYVRMSATYECYSCNHKNNSWTHMRTYTSCSNTLLGSIDGTIFNT